MRRLLHLLLALVLAGASLPPTTACSTLLVGRQATADGAVLLSHS